MRRYANDDGFRVEPGLNGRVAFDHVARNPAQQERPQPNQYRESVEHKHDQRSTRNNHGNADGKTENQQSDFALRGGCVRDHVVETHDDIGNDDDANSVPERGAGRDFIVLVFGHQQLGGNHKQRQTADQLQIRQRHQRGHDAREDDQEHHGDAGTDDHAPEPVPAVQAATGHRNYQRIVAGQQDVDPDDLANRQPESGRLYACPDLRKKSADRAGVDDLHQQVSKPSNGPMLVPTFRSSCSIAAPTFTNFGKSWATHKLIDSSTALSI